MPTQMTTSLDYYRQIIRKVEEMGLPVLKTVYPRKLRVPPGYFSPVFLVPTALSAAQFMMTRKADENSTVATVFATIQRLVEFKVPTYFADETLCHSLAATEPPESLKFSDIRWPFPAMLMMLPERFSLSYAGRKIIWMAGMRLEGDVDIDCKYEFVRPFRIEKKEPSISICAEVIEPNGRAAAFHVNMPESADVGGMMETPVQYIGLPQDDPSLSDLPPAMPFDPKTDGEVVRRIASMFIHLLLLSTARPEMVEEPTVIKKIDGRKKGEKIELWEPRFIGRGYRPPVKAANGNGGTHASPDPHWRSGHWRHQACGPGRTERKLTWIELVWVGGKDVDEKSAA